MKKTFTYSKTTGRPRVIGQPLFKIGDKVRNYTILSYLGQFTVHPIKAVALSKEHYWYYCKCTCGDTKVCNQQTLVDNRIKHQCSSCRKGS